MTTGETTVGEIEESLGMFLFAVDTRSKKKQMPTISAVNSNRKTRAMSEAIWFLVGFVVSFAVVSVVSVWVINKLTGPRG